VDERRRVVERLVEIFYELVLEDRELSHVFNRYIDDFEVHKVGFSDFWERALYRSTEYGRNPFQVHQAIEMSANHLDRWLELFECATRQTLNGEEQRVANQVARQMADSFKAILH
jgi:hemoglobin